MSRVLLPLSYTGTREKKGNVFLRHISHSFDKLQGRDLNPRPPGYEPDELPDCSTLRQVFSFQASIRMGEEGLEPSRSLTNSGF